MPKVSEQYRADRRAQILAAAARCVAKEGFHRTTMADVIAAAGLSAGAVYGYFASKQDLIRALAGEALEPTGERLLRLAERDAPVALRDVVEELIDSATSTYGDRSATIAVQIWAEAARDPEVGSMAADRFAKLRETVATAVARCQADGTVSVDADPDAVAQVLVGILDGLVVQQVVDRRVDRDRYVDGLLAITAP
ncbi:TetR/AcrR family transcriptional regulator [Nocardioides sp. URHA0032]|uniref:TetR/AcrR family transcriptional regulator n=1 Tax=Nocardioides sp. URHA0032 TaxID=1380388 RepID=UPI00048C17F6|nr:TetR/AcrR family transcriptional regulator [Nocardioides sp. URHA0032]